MTVTEELRRLLDERGVKWDKGAFPNEARTYWKNAYARPWNEQHLYVAALLTPEQIIEATLGRGMCKQVIVDCFDGLLPPFRAYCSACGKEWGFTPKFCPNCGREVKLSPDF